MNNYIPLYKIKSNNIHMPVCTSVCILGCWSCLLRPKRKLPTGTRIRFIFTNGFCSLKTYPTVFTWILARTYIFTKNFDYSILIMHKTEPPEVKNACWVKCMCVLQVWARQRKHVPACFAVLIYFILFCFCCLVNENSGSRVLHTHSHILTPAVINQRKIKKYCSYYLECYHRY